MLGAGRRALVLCAGVRQPGSQIGPWVSLIMLPWAARLATQRPSPASLSTTLVLSALARAAVIGGVSSVPSVSGKATPASSGLSAGVVWSSAGARQHAGT